MDLTEIECEGMDSSGLGKGLLLGICEQAEGSIFLNYLSNSYRMNPVIRANGKCFKYCLLLL